MTPKELELAFENAVNSINNHVEPFPADVLLKLYAYYKRATNNQDSPGSSNPLINAFKTNALFQSKGLTQEEAKKRYIETVNQYFLYRK
ncbi:MAG: acyl-CoA-binding protein [Alteromonas sp.]|nr:acyl-CoA-binding protein [Alteromonas sp.]MAY23316.1 acyl-CoA-binding protein [Flavobacteriaceae bacterium]|tara:strand:+ start:25471 stop:25737 length:267 start_codon:yes stop_codon:yes gene_type:complete